MKKIRDNLKILLFFCCMLVACVVTKDEDQSIQDPKLEAMVDDFAAKCDRQGLRCSNYRERPSITWGKTKGFGTAAMCETIEIMGINFAPKITIGYDMMDNTPDEIRAIVYHELIHCYFFVDHHPGDSPHIMRWYYLHQQEIDQAGGLDALLDEFFHGYKLNGRP